MPEPITPSAAMLLAAPPAVSMLTAFGVNLGLRPDVLVAGFSGALVAIVLLNSVPAEGDTWRHLVKATFMRLFVALASSVTAGYITPLALLAANLPDSLLLGGAFAVGAGAQRVLRRAIDRFDASTPAKPSAGGPAA